MISHSSYCPFLDVGLPGVKYVTLILSYQTTYICSIVNSKSYFHTNKPDIVGCFIDFMTHIQVIICPANQVVISVKKAFMVFYIHFTYKLFTHLSEYSHESLTFFFSWLQHCDLDGSKLWDRCSYHFYKDNFSTKKFVWKLLHFFYIQQKVSKLWILYCTELIIHMNWTTYENWLFTLS